ncbi:Protein of unknown function [Actinopolyspora mzabensis]|uniref:DUF2283 domain-containing protein n=1 Tax=Actinopolyspora mzabensis TaxID=995066 RepID=A0A1G8X782_ACTMZ|nr:DUF2283 domain-containing protein [Actinopolyspora mzabensis]SDJ86166.1 Protein of unknown function [Actinopolyspora mzabensis]
MNEQEPQATGSLHVEWSWDKRANAAVFKFDGKLSGNPPETLEVRGKNDETVALLDFSDDGELLNLELLDAEKHMPRSCRD